MLKLKRKYKCIVCGEEIEYTGTIKISEIKLPHGKFYVCYKRSCKDILTLRINDGSFPAVWVGSDDLYEKDYNEILTKEEAEKFETEDMIQIAQDTAEALGDCFWDDYREAVKMAIEWWREKKEKEYIETCPKEDLPLLIGNIEYKPNQQVFENRLKES